MFEIKVTIAAPELAGAMMRLADAISAKPAAYSPAEPATPAEPAPAKKEAKKEAKPAPAKAEKPAPAPKPEPIKAEPAPAPAPQPAPAAEPAPAATAATPTTQPEKPFDLEAIARAGAGLVDQGKMPQIMELLKNYQVRAITELKQEQYADFAKDLRALGAAI